MWDWIWEFLHPPPEGEDDDSKYPDDGDLDCPDTQPTTPGALE